MRSHYSKRDTTISGELIMTAFLAPGIGEEREARMDWTSTVTIECSVGDPEELGGDMDDIDFDENDFDDDFDDDFEEEIEDDEFDTSDPFELDE